MCIGLLILHYLGFSHVYFYACRHILSEHNCQSMRCKSWLRLNRTMSSANLRWLRYSPLVRTPGFLYLSFLNAHCREAVNNCGDIVSPCRTPLCIGNLQVLSRSHIIPVLPSHMSLKSAMYASSTPWSRNTFHSKKKRNPCWFLLWSHSLATELTPFVLLGGG